MLNTPSTSSTESLISEFTIEFSKADPCYSWGEVIHGKLSMKCPPSTQLDVVSVKLQIAGYTRFKGKQRSIKEENYFLKKERNLLSGPVTYYDGKKEIPFQETLPPDLPTSVETKVGRIGYYLKTTLVYKNKDGSDTTIHAVRGFSMIEDVDLNVLPKQYFEERNQIVHQKFGLFSCTGGLVRLAIILERSAFVSGEFVTITGRIENKSDRRVEKVSAVIQQRAHCKESPFDKHNDETDVVDVFEESLALFVDPTVTLKIDKKMPIPVLPPSTPQDEHSIANRVSKRRISIGNLRSRPSQLSLNLSQLSPSRPLSISYSLCFQVKCVGVDNLQICWPIVIGSVPLTSSTVNNDPQATTHIFKQCKHEKPYDVVHSNSINNIGKTRISYINKYPFFSDLKTSSKQGKKISLWANTVRMEHKWLNAVRDKETNKEKKGVMFNANPVNATYTSQESEDPRRISDVALKIPG
ncbi:unnamed protein product, partial [Mesorhabditis belari]|uniref:Arrestin C-terminal-like domain-containing protein n=1 Tax=Mesorhabditis belari TaxID=2138241 RepID=A0AAF3FB72_9BILA